MTYFNQTSNLTIKQLKEIAKTWGVIPNGDKRKKKTWIDAVDAKRQELAPEKPTVTAEAKTEVIVEQPQPDLFIPAINEDGDQFKLGDYIHLYGTPQYKLLEKLAIQGCCEQNNLYRSFFNRAIELGMIDRDPGFDGGLIRAT